MPGSRFQLLDKLGEGGMGTVYAAYDRERAMQVAVKKLRRMDAHSLYQFKREFRALRGLSHPNIITLYDLVQERDDWYLAMEVVEGSDFITYVRGGRLSDDPTTAQDRRFLTESMETVEVEASSADMSALPMIESPSDIPVGALTRIPVVELVDLGRLRDALGQLAHALWVLHSSGVVHRDLKPSNVRIGGDGRVVLMDFGIVAELQQTHDSTREGRISGTPVYMAPEQLEGVRPTPATDWYAFGAMMYYAFTGRRLYGGTAAQVLADKRRYDPQIPSATVAGLPPELERLCMDLLSRRPEDRPSDAEVLERLGCRVEVHESIARAQMRAVFVGRDAELAALEAAFERTRGGAPECAIVEGASGMGKSSLLERFTATLERAAGDGEHGDGEHSDGDGRALVLSGICYESESIPYKAFDGAIDGLSLHLARLDDDARRRVLPPDAALIARLFPVFRRVPECEDEGTLDDLDVQGLRERAFAALRALVYNLGRARPVALRIDDLQWADKESLDLLVQLLRAPAPAGLLVLIALRLDAVDEPQRGRVQAALDALDRAVPCARIALGPLSEAEQRQLVARVSQAAPMGDDARDDARADAFLREAGGHPMLLVELARHALENPDAGDSAVPPHLDDVLWRRVQRLPTSTRALAEAVAIAGEPASLHALGRACGLTDGERERAAAELDAACLAQVHRTGRSAVIDAAHHRVRASIAANLDAARARDLHELLARALQALDAAPTATVARHWLAASKPRQAAINMLRAARGAARQLAFDRAMDLFREALALLPEDAGDTEIERFRCRARIGLAQAMRITERSDEAMAELERALPAAEALDLVEDLSMIHYLRGSLFFPRGDIARCLEAHQRARHYADRAGAPKLRARAMSGLGDAYYMRGQFRSANRHYDECIRLARERGMTSIEAANLGARGMTRYLLGDLDAALQDSASGAELSARIGDRRAEMVTRCGSLAFVLLEMERFAQARGELEIALELARSLSARRFESHALAMLGHITAAEGDRAAGLAMIEDGLAICEEIGYAFMGPAALGLVARLTDDDDARQRALDRGERVLRSGAVSHNYLFFYRDAMEVAVARGDADALARFAGELEAYTRREPTRWSQFVIERARALAAHAAGSRDEALLQALRDLRDEADGRGFRAAARALAAACQAS